MVLKVLPLRSRSRNQMYDAVLFVNDKALIDEIELAFDKMLSSNTETTREDFGLIKLLIKPRTKGGKFIAD
jgi:hypothetical protein